MPMVHEIWGSLFELFPQKCYTLRERYPSTLPFLERHNNHEVLEQKINITRFVMLPFDTRIYSSRCL